MSTPHSGDWLLELLGEYGQAFQNGNLPRADKAAAQILSKHKLEVLEGRIDEIKKVPFDIDTPNISWLYFKNRQTELENERSKIEGES